MSLGSVATKAAGAAASSSSSSKATVAAASAVGKAASGVATTTNAATAPAKANGPTGVAAIANAYGSGASTSSSSSSSSASAAVVKTISAAGLAAAANPPKSSATPAVTSASAAAGGAAKSEQLGAGWSRDAGGALQYQSDLLSQLVVPGRVPADQFFSSLANGDFSRAGASLVAWVLEDILVVATLGGSQAKTAGTKLAAVAAAPTEQALAKGQLQLNKAAGAEFQQRVSSMGAATLDNFVEEVSIRPNTADGVADFKIRIDGMGTKPGTQSVDMLEAKGSATAPLTKNQAKGFPLVEEYGGIVTGANGGTTFPSGTSISPGTTIRVIRPNDLK